METNLLIIGAGPFGLALSAQASHQGLEHLIVGTPTEFWRQNMPKGMYLRSNCEWHLDPLNVHTIRSFIHAQGKTPADVEPLSLEFYQSYVDWFLEQKRIAPAPVTSVAWITRLRIATFLRPQTERPFMRDIDD
jgi:cation diffusion facilitator CzcD-associated flavoprotein CzcO